MTMCKTGCVGVFLIVLIAAACPAGDWAQWRGSDRDGLSPETGLLDQWPEDGPPLLWKATGLGKGYSTVSMSGGRIFTMGDKDGACYVHALNRADGNLLWSTKLGKAGAPGWGGFAGPRSTPTVDGELRWYFIP